MLQYFRVFQVATEFYQLCKEVRLPLPLKDQLLRASSSIALNCAEGSGKLSPTDQRRYYSTCLGSLREAQAILILEKVEDPRIKDLTKQLGAMLFTLCKPHLKKEKSKTETETETN